MWANLHNHTHGSLLDGLSKPEQVIERCVTVGIPTVAITDHGTISECIPFLKAKKNVIRKFERQKKKLTDQKLIDEIDIKIGRVKTLKQILGNEYYIADSETINSHLVVLAKNKDGWKSLIKSSGEASRKENFYRKPRLKLEQFAEYASGNLITFSGHMGSALANILFLNIDEAYRARTIAEATLCLDPEYEKKAVNLFGRYQEIFGKENVFAEIQRIDVENLPAAFVTAEIVRKLAKKYGWPCVATADAHYPTKNDCHDQRVQLCIALHTTLPTVDKKINIDDEDVGLGGFFKSSNYYIPTPEEMAALHTEEELANSMKIADMCEEYSVLTKPVIPQFKHTNGMSQDEYLRQLCRDGWKKKIVGRVDPSDYQEYGDRVKKELGVFEKAGLAGYFLTLWEVAEFVKRNGRYCGVGRGSAAGCMVSYLIGLTAIDPIPYDLLTERFYNDGRNTPDHTSMPDIDFDVQASFRDMVIGFMKDTHGVGNVGQISTFGRMMGRGVIKDVLRVHEACSFEEMNKITEYIPDEAEISDQLQVMREEEGESSIITWALQNNAKELKEWAYLDDTGEVQGKYAKYFKQAIRLEGTKRSQGKHAAGVVISTTPLLDSFPVIYDRKTDEPIIAVDMNSVEDLGGIKYDILGISVLDKLYDFDKFLAEGEED
jgi:DNA polymerase-3 subunit alpha